MSFFVLLALAASQPQGSSALQPGQYWALPLGSPGRSSISCASAFQNAPNKQAIRPWVMGLWTGLNLAYRASVGHTTDLAGIMGEVEIECAKAPSDELIDGATKAYMRLRATKK